MKSLIMLFSLSLGTYLNSTAQPYSYYINSSSKWQMRAGGANGIFAIRSRYTYYISGDSTFGSHSYFKLYSAGVDSAFPMDTTKPVTVTQYNRYMGLLRESYDKKFYFIFSNHTDEKLLFEFNLMINETLWPTYTNEQCDPNYLRIKEYDYVQVDKQYRKRYSTGNDLVNKIIEGVGCEGGLIENSCICLRYHYNSRLICYSKNNSILQVTAGVDCHIPTGIPETAAVRFNLYPNPANDKITLSSSEDIESIDVYNSLGQRVLSYETRTESQTELNISALPSGVYFIQARIRDKVYCSRFIRE